MERKNIKPLGERRIVSLDEAMRRAAEYEMPVKEQPMKPNRDSVSGLPTPEQIVDAMDNYSDSVGRKIVRKDGLLNSYARKDDDGIITSYDNALWVYALEQAGMYERAFDVKEALLASPLVRKDFLLKDSYNYKTPVKIGALDAESNFMFIKSLCVLGEHGHASQLMEAMRDSDLHFPRNHVYYKMVGHADICDYGIAAYVMSSAMSALGSLGKVQEGQFLEVKTRKSELYHPAGLLRQRMASSGKITSKTLHSYSNALWVTALADIGLEDRAKETAHALHSNDDLCNDDHLLVQHADRQDHLLSLDNALWISALIDAGMPGHAEVVAKAMRRTDFSKDDLLVNRTINDDGICTDQTITAASNAAWLAAIAKLYNAVSTREENTDLPFK